jgi:hypothetical protein
LANVEELVVLDEIQIQLLNSPQLKSTLYLKLKSKLWLFQRSPNVAVLYEICIPLLNLPLKSILYLRLKFNHCLLQ